MSLVLCIYFQKELSNYSLKRFYPYKANICDFIIFLLFFVLKGVSFLFLVDMWSVGCIFAELLGRKILFQAQSPIQQVRQIYCFAL